MSDCEDQVRGGPRAVSGLTWLEDPGDLPFPSPPSSGRARSSPVHHSLAGAACTLYPLPLPLPYLSRLPSQPPQPPGPLFQVVLAARPEGCLVLCCSLRFWTGPDRRVHFPLPPPEGAVLGRSRAAPGLGRKSGDGDSASRPLCECWAFSRARVGWGKFSDYSLAPTAIRALRGQSRPSVEGPTRPEGYSFILPTCADARC